MSLFLLWVLLLALALLLVLALVVLLLLACLKCESYYCLSLYLTSAVTLEKCISHIPTVQMVSPVRYHMIKFQTVSLYRVQSRKSQDR